MTAIKDMTATERQSWLTLLADGAVLIWFWQKMTVGLSPVPIDYDINTFGDIIIGLVIMTVVLHVIIAVVFEMVGNTPERGKDERDIAIERLGAYWGYRLFQIGVGVITVGILMSAGFGETLPLKWQFGTPVQIIFALAIISYVADLTRHGVMVFHYGR